MKIITIEKLKEYEAFRGYYDGFYLQKVKSGENSTSNEEWNLISELAQDIRMVHKKLAAESFVEILNNRLKENCEDDETIELLKDIAVKGW